MSNFIQFLHFHLSSWLRSISVITVGLTELICISLKLGHHVLSKITKYFIWKLLNTEHFAIFVNSRQFLFQQFTLNNCPYDNKTHFLLLSTDQWKRNVLKRNFPLTTDGPGCRVFSAASPRVHHPSVNSSCEQSKWPSVGSYKQSRRSIQTKLQSGCFTVKIVNISENYSCVKCNNHISVIRTRQNEPIKYFAT